MRFIPPSPPSISQEGGAWIFAVFDDVPLAPNAGIVALAWVVFALFGALGVFIVTVAVEGDGM
jgi:hypothetical protein